MSLQFTGSSTDEVRISATSSIDDLTTWTKIVWLYFDSWDNFTSVWAKGRSGNEDKHMVLRNNSSQGFDILVRRSTTSDSHATGNTSVSTGQWTYLAATYDSGGTSGERIKFYQGDLTTVVTFQNQGGTGSGTITDNSQDLVICGDNDNFYPAIDGRIALFTHWNRVLTLGEIQAQQFRPHVTSGCVVFMPLGFSGTTTQVDYSGQGNSGAITGTSIGDHVPVQCSFGHDLPTSYTAVAGAATRIMVIS